MKRYLPQLDGLRTVAVLLVVALHTGLIDTGYVGVDIFFVLSGYLITTILVRERESGSWSLRAFYGRRMRRLYPALLVMLALTLPVEHLIVHGGTGHQLAVVALSGGYLSDFAAGINVNWLGGFGHTWSLAVEEQFYLLWPLGLLWVIRSPRGLRVLVLAAALMLASMAVGPKGLMFLPFTRGGVLLVGCALALWLKDHRVAAPTLLSIVSALALAAVLVIAPAWMGVANSQTTFVGLGSILAALATAGLIAGLLDGGVVARLLAVKPMVWLGQRSYGIYLWHVPLVIALANYSLGARIITVAGSVVLAALSYRLVETRFRRSERAARDDVLPAAAGVVGAHAGGAGA